MSLPRNITIVLLRVLTGSFNSVTEGITWEYYTYFWEGYAEVLLVLMSALPGSIASIAESFTS
jgi:hypothetical protein